MDSSWKEMSLEVLMPLEVRKEDDGSWAVYRADGTRKSRHESEAKANRSKDYADKSFNKDVGRGKVN